MRDSFRKFSWNYEPSDDYKKFGSENQSDWNQTLLTQFNFINATLCGAHMPRNKIIVTPIKFKKIIKSLEFYDSNDSLIANHYFVEFVDDDIDYLNVQGVPLKIENFI